MPAKARRTSWPRIVESGVKSYLKEVTLLDQPFVARNSSKTNVAQVLKEAEQQAPGRACGRFGIPEFRVGALCARRRGIEKERSDFAAEVAAQGRRQGG